MILESADVATDHEVGLAGGEGVGLQLLSEDVHLHFFVSIFGNLQDAVLCYGEDAAGAAGAIVDVVGVVGNLIGDRQHGEVGQ